jgi:hypothetical protein
MNFGQRSPSALSRSSHALAPFSSTFLRPIKYLITPLESALLQVLILNNFNFARINTYEKPGGRGPIIVNHVTVNQTLPNLLPVRVSFTNPFQAVGGPV